MIIVNFFRSWVRRLQGERRGMGSQLTPPTAEEERRIAELYPQSFFAPSIIIQTIVRLADVSFWQGVINFVLMKAAGLFGVIIRAGQNTWADSKFRINWSLAKAAKLPRGSYWFYDSRVDPGRQAELWAAQLGGDLGELPHAADFEESYGGAFGKVEHFKAFLQRFQQLTGLKDDRIIIYTGFYWWLERVRGDPWFRRYRLWIASYGPMSGVRIPAPWTIDDLLFWQYTASGDGKAYGVGSLEIDLNYYARDPLSYIKQFPLAAMDETPIPPPEGEPMTEYNFSITPTGSAGSKVRPEPDTGNTSNLTLPFGKYAYGNQRITIADDKYEMINNVRTQVNKAGDVWLKVLEVNGVVLPQPGYIAEIHLGQRWATIKPLQTTPPPPPEEPQEEIVITQTFSSPGYVSQTVTTTLKPEE